MKSPTTTKRPKPTRPAAKNIALRFSEPAELELYAKIKKAGEQAERLPTAQALFVLKQSVEGQTA